MARHNPPIKALQIFRPRWLRASIAERAEYASNLVSQSREFFSRELTRESVGRDARCFCLGFRLVESLVHTVVGLSACCRATRASAERPVGASEMFLGAMVQGRRFALPLAIAGWADGPQEPTTATENSRQARL
jgi:hypothetical protein